MYGKATPEYQKQQATGTPAGKREEIVGQSAGAPLTGEVGDEPQSETVSQVLQRVKFVQTFWK